MKVRCYSPAELPTDLRARWIDLLDGDPELSSPYFRPEFTEVVGRARADTFVAVVDDGAAFLPFHREAYNAGVGRPIGAFLSDYQGVISAPGFEFDAAALVRGAGLSAWAFNHVPASQRAFGRWAETRSESAQVEIAKWERGAPQLTEENRKRRKLAPLC